MLMHLVGQRDMRCCWHLPGGNTEMGWAIAPCSAKHSTQPILGVFLRCTTSGFGAISPAPG